MERLQYLLGRLAHQVSSGASSPWMSLLALLLSAAWLTAALLSGYMSTLHFPRSWESVLVVVTSLVTFVMVFLLQSAQERDTRAIQLKLDELLRAVEGARDHHLVGLERRSVEELERVQARLEAEPPPSNEDAPPREKGAGAGARRENAA